MNQKIAVFDSGLGGLTILKELVKTYPQENFIYLGDTARLPYGSKSPFTIRQYLEQNINYLKKSHSLKAVIVACNSASTTLVNEERRLNELPIFEVITPGASAALKATNNNRIGVIATHATIENSAYKRELTKQSQDTDLVVFEKATPLLVPLVEEGFFKHKITDDVIAYYLNSFKEQIDTLILGCTHYPALKIQIQNYLGPNIQLIDSAAPITFALKNHIKVASDTQQGTVQLLLTDHHTRYDSFIKTILDPISGYTTNHVNIT